MQKKYIYSLVAIAVFAAVSIAYFYPLLQGKKLYQSDIVQFKGMSKEIVDFRREHHKEPYWTGSAFSGMPAYQISAHYPHDYLKKLDRILRVLPVPAGYVFLYFIGFFLLMRAFGTDILPAAAGSIAFGLSTYLIIILGVGHNAKAHAIAYMPAVLAGAVWLFKGRYLLGFTVSALSAGLEIAAGHIQMSYYLFFILVIFGIYELKEHIKSKRLPEYFRKTGVWIFSGILALLMNANHLLPTREYSKESTRSPSELTLTPGGKKKERTGGLDKEYITEYSYGILESFNLFIPRLTGGSNAENLGSDSHTYRLLRDKFGASDARTFVKNAPMYWGEQPIVAAPAYVGAVVVFLFVMALFLPGIRHRGWILTAIVLSLLLSWGKNFSFLTDFFIDHVPLYDKFRAVSSIQVILELLIPVLGILGLSRFIELQGGDSATKALKYSLYITAGTGLFFLLIAPQIFSFEALGDARFASVEGLQEALVRDRVSLLRRDSIHTLALVFATALWLWLYIRKRLSSYLLVLVIGALFLLDLWSVDRRYVNSGDFVPAAVMDKPFVPGAADKEIWKDTGYFRVANFTVNPLSDGTTSYFHKSIGGYHAAKPRRYQELFDYQVNKNNFEVLNMLNTKYLIVPGGKGEPVAQLNPGAYGPAWFVKRIKWADNADMEIRELDSLDNQTAVVNMAFKRYLRNFQPADDRDSIKMISYLPNELKYEYHSSQGGLAVFSEMYYPHGWKAYVDGSPLPVIRANYVLRALSLPAGDHNIRFIFEPQIVKTGGNYSLAGYFLFIIAVVAGYFLSKKKRKAGKQ